MTTPPGDPVTDIRQAYVALHVMYGQLRDAGFGILAAAAYCVAFMHYAGGEADSQPAGR